MKLDISSFEIRECDENDLAAVLELQDDTFRHLENPELLRKNTPEMLLDCLRPPHVTLGAWYQGELAALSVLYVPLEDAEKLMPYLDGVSCEGMNSANYKLCIVKKAFRGNGLQYELGKRLLLYAADMPVDILCATASPLNSHSIRNMEKLGFSYNKTTHKYGMTRNLYYKIL